MDSYTFTSPHRLPRIRILPVLVVQMGIGSLTVLAREIGYFVGTGGSFATLYVREDGTKISAEDKVSERNDSAIPPVGSARDG